MMLLSQLITDLQLAHDLKAYTASDGYIPLCLAASSHKTDLAGRIHDWASLQYTVAEAFSVQRGSAGFGFQVHCLGL